MRRRYFDAARPLYHGHRTTRFQTTRSDQPGSAENGASSPSVRKRKPPISTWSSSAGNPSNWTPANVIHDPQGCGRRLINEAHSEATCRSGDLGDSRRICTEVYRVLFCCQAHIWKHFTVASDTNRKRSSLARSICIAPRTETETKGGCCVMA